MSDDDICTLHADYLLISKDVVSIIALYGQYDHFIFHSRIRSSNGDVYKVRGFDQFYIDFVEQDFSAKIISFSKSSEIAVISSNLFTLCESKFVFPPKIKRICHNLLACHKLPLIKYENANHFVSATNNTIFLNHFPLELIWQNSNKKRHIIRETIRVIGSGAFGKNNNITKVIFPSSVETIGDYAFYVCCSLNAVFFKRNSKLKSIGNFAFYYTNVKKIQFPASLEEIMRNAFGRCHNLSSISFPNDSKLRIVGDCAFQEAIFSKVVLPPEIKIIHNDAFFRCNELTLVSFSENQNGLKINFGQLNIKHTS